MKTYDCFLFYNELELLDLRLRVLNDVVDKFVLVEANRTFKDREKPFIFDDNKHLFKKYLDKIIHVKVSDLPPKNGDWNIERFQRDCIRRGLQDVEENDKVIISDVDEILNPATVAKYKDSTKPVTFNQHLFYYFVNCMSNRMWDGPIMTPYVLYSFDPSRLRTEGRFGNYRVADGGWHYSYLGGAERVKLKLDNLSDGHTRREEVGNDEDIERKIATQKDLWDEGVSHTLVDPNEYGPPQIGEFIKEYPHVFYNRPA